MSGVVLITGGAGFIGTNLAARLARDGYRVRVYDDLSRAGVERNLAWLRTTFGNRIDVRLASVSDRDRMREAVAGTSAVFHFAAQTAVTTSLVEPRHDFAVNAAGTLEVLEAIRALREPPPLIYTSTNKVYGCLPDVPLELAGTRWQPVDAQLRARGIAEDRPLELRTPYGCSKGAADQYVLDYAHCYGLRTAVFRMSCIYGPHQLGTEDQGWVAHFMIRALEHAPLTIYGDGCQVRDVLFVDDLVAAFVAARDHIDRISGRAFNIGGGPANTLSLRELLALIEQLGERSPEVRHEDWRQGDQRYYVSDTTAFTEATGWRPQVNARAGIEALYGWLEAHHA